MCKKTTEEAYHQKNRKAILNRAKELYGNNKEVLGKKARNKYRELCEKENMEEADYNMSEEKETKIKENQKMIAGLKNQKKKIFNVFFI